MKDRIRTCNPMVRFSNFTLNIKIYDKFERFFCKLVWRKTLFEVITMSIIGSEFPSEIKIRFIGTIMHYLLFTITIFWCGQESPKMRVEIVVVWSAQ